MMKRIHILTAKAMPGTFVVLAILVIFFISTKVCFSEGCTRSPCPSPSPSYTTTSSPPSSSGSLSTFFGNSVCDSNNLANCQTQDDCVANGGEWYSYSTASDIRCRERATTVSTSPPSSPSSSTGASTLDQEFDPVGGEWDFSGGVDSAYLAQTFTVGITGTLDRIETFIINQDNGPPIDDLIVEIWETNSNGMPDKSKPPLASIVYDESSVPTNPVNSYESANWFVSNLVPYNISVNSGDVLAIVIRESNNTANTDYGWSGLQYNPYSRGKALRSHDNGSTWPFFDGSGYDFGFKTYVSPSSSGSSSGSSSNSNSFFSFLFGSGSDNSDACGPDNLEVCDQQGCEALGAEYWWYDGSCRAGSLEVDYSGHISQAPVRLGDDANDGSITDGDGLSIIVDTPTGGRSYGVLIFPGNLGYYFFDSENGLMTQIMPLTDGEMFVTDDLCNILQEIPELEGNWVVAVLTVPIAAPEFYTLDDIATYLQDGGLYYFGSYSVNVHCQADQGNWFFHLLQ